MSNTIVEIDFDRYHRFDELVEIWKSLAEAYPSLAHLYSIGKSYRDREIWMLELTNREKGAPEDKPGYYVDGVTHPEEVSGAMVTTYAAWYLLTNYEKDELATTLLDTRTVYVVPCVNPDAYEICMEGQYYEWHGNARFLPGDEQVGPGLHYGDINGDGYITRMRVKDQKGEWKISKKDPRLMIPREPFEYGNEYYRILPEGLIEDYDGVEFDIPRPRDGNTNRNFPDNWAPEGEQYGAGKFPLSEPEIKAVVDFILSHSNITGSIHFHTNAGVILPPFRGGDNPMNRSDLRLFKKLGKIGIEETGYNFLATEEEFSGKGSKPRRGTSTGFLYGQQGIICYVVELWDIYKEAGIGDHPFSSPRELSEEDGLKLLKWNDDMLDGKSFFNWASFEHSQLGSVEIGGWQTLYMFRNPPPRKLREMCHNNSMFVIKHALASPLIKIQRAEVMKLGDGLYKLVAVAQNLGFLSTNITEQALKMKIVEPVTLKLQSEDAVEVIQGSWKQELGHLAGWSDRPYEYARFARWGQPAKKAEWVIRVKEGEKVQVKILAESTKGGKDSVFVELV